MNVYLIKSFSLRLLSDEINKIIGKNNNVVRMNMDEITIDDIISECSYYSVLNEPKYVIINNFKIGKESEKIDKYFENPNPDTTLILIADSIDKRSAIYKKINSQGTVILIEDVKDLNAKISAYCKKQDLKVDYLAINKLLDNNLNNYDLVLNEIDKISTMLTTITLDDVIKYSPKLISEENFDFCDAVIKKNYQMINEYLNDFIKLKQEVGPFISLLAGQYRLIYAVKNLNGSNEQIGDMLGVHPYRIKLAKEKSYNYTMDDIQKKLLDLCDLDYNIKTSNIDKYILLKIFLINV